MQKWAYRSPCCRSILTRGLIHSSAKPRVMPAWTSSFHPNYIDLKLQSYLKRHDRGKLDRHEGRAAAEPDHNSPMEHNRTHSVSKQPWILRTSVFWQNAWCTCSVRKHMFCQKTLVLRIVNQSSRGEDCTRVVPKCDSDPSPTYSVVSPNKYTHGQNSTKCYQIY